MRIVLGLLLALLELSWISGTAAVDDFWSADKPCRARAWVRAPDLHLGQVVRGDVKVKLDGGCEDVLGYTLRLRFAERSWVKTRQQAVQLPKRPAVAYHPIRINSSNSTVLESITERYRFFGKESDWTKYQDAMNDPSLWLVREDERIGFEAKYNLGEGKQVSHDVVQSFAILVPSTIYPPAFNPSSGWIVMGQIQEGAGSEHIYAYVVDVAFSNDTIVEVPAGYTSFNAPPKWIAPREPETVNVTLSRTTQYRNTNNRILEVEEREDVDKFILQVTFPQGRHLEQGSVNDITVISHQVGPGIERPDRIGWLTLQGAQKFHWAASLAADKEAADGLLTGDKGVYSAQLRPTNPSTNMSPMSFPGPHMSHEELTRPRFSQDGSIQNGIMFSTKPVTVQFHVFENCYPQFDMHYQAIGANLYISMEVRNASLNPEVPEEYYWIPTMMKQSDSQPKSRLEGRIPLFIHSRQDDPTMSVTTESTHYLSPHARAPVFVDPETVQNLLQKSTGERDLLSPKAQPKFTTREGGDVIQQRYLGWNRWGQELPGNHYVGDTWLRKVVLLKPDNEAERQVSLLRTQS